VLVLLEVHGDLLPDVDVVRIAPHDVRGQMHGLVLGERHVGDRVRGLELRKPLLPVDGETDDRAPPGHDGRRPGPAATLGTHRGRWVDELPAVVAALDPEVPVGPRRPEPLVCGGQLGKRSHDLLLRGPETMTNLLDRPWIESEACAMSYNGALDEGVLDPRVVEWFDANPMMREPFEDFSPEMLALARSPIGAPPTRAVAPVADEVVAGARRRLSEPPRP